MRHTPLPPLGQARRVVFAFLFSGAAVFLLAPVFPAQRALFQTVAVVLFSVAIFTTTRYMLTSYSYAIEPKNRLQTEDGTVGIEDAGAFHTRYMPPCEMDLTVRKTQGRRNVTEARLSLSDLSYFGKLPLNGGRRREPYRLYPDMRVYNYTVSMRPSEQCMAVFVDEAGTAIGVILEVDGEMAACLWDTATKNGMK